MNETVRPRCFEATDLESARQALARVLPVAENDLPWRALAYAHEQLGGSADFAHSAGSALIVAELRLGADAVAAALLHACLGNAPAFDAACVVSDLQMFVAGDDHRLHARISEQLLAPLIIRHALAKDLARHAVVQKARLERMLASEEMVDKPGQTWKMKLAFADAPRSGQDVLMIRDVRAGYGAPGAAADAGGSAR